MVLALGVVLAPMALASPSKPTLEPLAHPPVPHLDPWRLVPRHHHHHHHDLRHRHYFGPSHWRLFIPGVGYVWCDDPAYYGTLSWQEWCDDTD